jgi:two-component system, OmpR family, sensor histidine kinase CreC
LATLEHQQQLSQVSNVNLSTLIQTQIAHLSQKTHALQASIHAACSPAIILQADEFLLGQAVYNLLENALDFSPPNTTISITVIEENSQTQIQVKDQGAGIPDYALDKVFDKFYSLPRPTTNQKSTGLGLNFVQEVAKLHGGSVTLSNHADGGAVATITLPKT